MELIILKSTKKVIVDLTYPAKTEYIYCYIDSFTLNAEIGQVNGGYYWNKEREIINEVMQYDKIPIKNFGTTFSHIELNSLYNYIRPIHEDLYNFPKNLIKDIKTTLLFYNIAVNPVFGLTEESDWEVII